MNRTELSRAALGRAPADLVIQGGRLVNVLTGEIYPANVAVKAGRVAAIGEVSAAVDTNTVVIDASGQYVLPGFIDQHVHTYESQLNVTEYATAVLARGTTAICTDFYGESTVGGKAAVRFSLDAAAKTPLKILFVVGIPGFYQNEPFGHSGVPTKEDMVEMLGWPECVGLNDTFASNLVAEDEHLLDLVALAQSRGKKICGHGSEIEGDALNAWTAIVPNTDDHECVDPAEALEKARRGVWVSMRQGSGCPNVPDLVRAITEMGADPRRFTFNTDLVSAHDLVAKGGIDHAVRTAIQHGLRPVTAIQIATLNAAECVGVSHRLGSVSPGKEADILLVDDLVDIRPRLVIAQGRVVARDGEFVAPMSPLPYPAEARNTVRLAHPVSQQDLALQVGGPDRQAAARVIRVLGDSLITEELRETVRVRDGAIVPDPDRDLLKIVALERHNRSGEIGKGLVRGFGLKAGAVASTYNPQQQNLQVVGTNDADMALAANELARIGGGMVAVRGGKVLACLELPLYGLLADKPVRDMAADYGRLLAAVRDLACPLPAPFHTLAFAGLPITIGKLKISSRGLVDVWRGEVVGLLAD